MEYVLMLVSLGIAATGIFFAYRFYVKDREAPARIRERIGGFSALVADKYRIDELYNATVIGPTLSLSRFLAAFDLLVIDGIVNLTGYLTRIVSTLNGWFDNMFVDGAVNGVGRLVAYLGARARSLQTGVIQYNVVGVFAGVLIMVLILVVLR
jgi:NADH-quinone oxidoreductase subunit L